MQDGTFQRQTVTFLAAILLVFGAVSTAFSAVPEPQSGGKFFQSKGTKAAPNYEGRAGGPSYEYGKGLQLWQVHLKPFANYSYKWDNNIFLEENGRESDFSHNLSTGVTGELPINGGQHVISGSYLADFEWFQSHTDQDHIDHTVVLGGDFNFVPFSLNLEDVFRRTVDRSDTEFTTRISREENTAHALLEIPFASFFLETEPYDLTVDYRIPADDIFSHNQFIIFQRVGIDVAPSTQLLAEYGYENIYYWNVNDRDGDANQAAVGLRGTFRERISYQIWGGAQWRIYDVASRPDFNGFIMRSAVQYEISEASKIVLKADRNPQESTFDDQSFYVRNRIELGWTQQIAERLFFNTRENIQYNEYSRITVRDHTERTRRDYVWESAVGLEYFMPNDLISFFGEYKYSARESNTSLLSYDDQTVSAGIRSKF